MEEKICYGIVFIQNNFICYSVMVLKMTSLMPWNGIYSVQLYLLQCDGVKADLSDAMEWYLFSTTLSVTV